MEQTSEVEQAIVIIIRRLEKFFFSYKFVFDIKRGAIDFKFYFCDFNGKGVKFINFLFKEKLHSTLV